MPFYTKGQKIDANGWKIEQHFDPSKDEYEVISKMEYYGRSTDAKPIGAKLGAVFLEIDTKILYIYNGSNWEVF